MALKKPLAYSLTFSLTAAALSVALAPTAQAEIYAPAATELQASADFLSRELAAGQDGIIAGLSGLKDIGLTQDMLLALDALDPDSTQAQISFNAMMSALDGYLYFGGEVDAARLAKTVVVADAFEQPNEQLVEQLVDTVQDNGQLKNETAGAPTSDVQNFGQSWGVLALARAGKTAEAQRAADFLETQICADGGVPLTQKIEQTCASTDPDTTALAAQAFALVNGVKDESTTSTLNYLKAAQGDDGGITSPFLGANVNSTALAASAFALAEEEEHFAQAHSYLESVRFGNSAASGLSGGFAWRSSDVASATRVTDQIRRGSAQAAIAYAGGNYANDAVIFSDAPAPTDSGSSAGSAGIVIAVLAVLAAIAGVLGPLLTTLPAQF
ncbi:hypothetical protein SFC07_03770 [Corynebacterium callunae]|uniref:hypothetical protein n=1 Tax=Corynebacterium callunae TaxID=1721 RepID=UPI003982923B